LVAWGGARKSEVVSSRVRTLAGSHNVRDLGGIATADGRVVREGLVFRSDYPAFADDGTGDAVRSLGLRAVVDLRRGNEAAAETVTWHDHGVTYYRHPLVGGDRTSWHARYRSYLTTRPDSVVDAVRHLLDPANHPVLFHCAAGKDRTGVVAAMLLSVLGIEDDEIVADYLLSDEAVAPILDRLTSTPLYRRMLAGTTVEEQRPTAEAMRDFLRDLDAERWLRDHGLTSDELGTGRQALLS
jgi:protein tyrosine/serine phosphatase